MRRFKLLLLLILFLMSGCSKSSENLPKQNPVIGFSQSGTESSWRKAHTKSITTELKKNDYEVLYRNAYTSHEKQLQDVRAFIAYKVDLIIIAPLQEDGWEPVLRTAKKAHIPVIIVDRHTDVTDQNLFLTHIGPSFKAEGNRAGLYAINNFSESKLKSINILELTGLPGTSPSKLRHDGFLETISRDPRMHITERLIGNYTRNKAQEVVDEYLSSHKQEPLDVLFSHNDEMTLGAIEALQELAPGTLDNLVIISVDGQKEMIDLLKAGVVNSVVECNPHVGWYVQNTISRYFNGYEIPNEIYIPETVFSDQGDLSMIPTRNY